MQAMKPAVIEKRYSVALQNRQVQFKINLKDGTWSGINRKTGITVFRNAHFRIDDIGINSVPPTETEIRWSKRAVRSPLGSGIRVRISYKPQADFQLNRILELTLFENQPFVQIGWGVNNPHDYTVRIQKVDLLCDGQLFTEQAIKKPRLLRGGAGAEPNLVEKGWQIYALNSAMLTIGEGEERSTMVAGGLHYTEFMREVLLDKKPLKRGAPKAPYMNLTCRDEQGKRIAPGETFISTDTSYLDIVTSDPFEALERYGEALRTANRAKPNNYNFPTLCGWMVSTGYGECLPINTSPGLVNQMDLAQERGLMKYTPLAVRLEPDYYCHGDNGNTQQGWWDDQHWAKYGSLLEPYETFDKFCKAVMERGGIPFTYFQCSMPSNDFATAHPEWMLNEDISRLHATHPHHRPFVRYDYTHPDFREHMRNVWGNLREAGLKGVKFDYPETAWNRNGGFHDTSFTTTSAYRELYLLCRNGLGRDAFIHERILGNKAHEYVPRTDVTAGIVDLQRVWGDASHFEPEMASRIGLRWYKSRRVFLYYPDGKSFYRSGGKKPIPSHERRAFLTIIALLSGRLEIGTSIGSMTDDMLHDMTRIFPAFEGTQSPRPVDMLLGKAHPEIYDYTVSTEWHQVVLLNNSKRKKLISAPLSGDQAETGSLALDSKSHYHIFDFWKQEYVGRLKGSDTLELPVQGQAVAMLSIRRVSSYPQMISTNRHVMQGMVECHDIVWDPKENTLSGKVDIVGDEPFVLTVARNGHTVKECSSTAKVCELIKRKDGRGLVDIIFTHPLNRKAKFALTFDQRQ